MSDMTDVYCEPCLFVKLEKVKADVLCEDCLERYCEQCALDHAKFRVFRNHQISRLASHGQYENAEYLVPANVSFGRKMTDGSHTTYYNDHPGNRNMEDTGSSSDKTPEVFRETRLIKEHTSTQRDSNSFEVKLTETDLTKRIPGIDRDDIAGSIFLFTVENAKISLFLKNREVFTCALSIVRRYGKRENKVKIKLGRGCEFGVGELCLISDRAKDIFSVLRQTTHNTDL